MPMVEVDGHRVAYQRVGAGPPLLLLHGYVGDGASTWRPQLDALSDDFTVVAWDAPGRADRRILLNASGWRDTPIVWPGSSMRLALDKPHVVGLSFGGALAIEFCRLYPAVPSTLTLVGAYAGSAGSLPPTRGRTASPPGVRAVRAVTRRVRRHLVANDVLRNRAAGAGSMLSAAAMLAFHPAGFRAMACAAAEDLRPALWHIDVPTLLIYGANDVRAPKAVADHLHRAGPGSTLVPNLGVGHV